MYVCTSKTKSLSLTIFLQCLLFDNFSGSDDVDISIKRCTLYVNWTTENTDGCSLFIYRVQLYRNETEIATLDTKALRYSKDGIDSESVFRVEITPVLRCGNNSDLYRRKRVKSIRTIPGKQRVYITKNISENVTLECPLNGAYQPFNVKWQHVIGINRTVVRTFTTQMLNLQSLSYRDMGRYICTVEYSFCGTSRSLRKTESSVTCSINGPPFISSSQDTFIVNPGQNLTLELKVISFPPPNSQVVIKNIRGYDIFRELVSFKTESTPLQAYGKTVEVEGYNTRFYLLNISVDWFGANNIIVFNRFGNYSIRIFLQNFSEKEKNFIVNFLRENTILLAGVGGGILVLFLVVIVTVIIWDIRRKKRQKNMTLNGNQNQNGEAENPTSVPSNSERIYARPFSFGNNNKGNASAEVQRLTDHERQIELERKQCASMYSYGGFSMNEFQDDEIMYDNQFAPEYK
ncbi:uncharacterized protein LOC133173298 isoform X2 [Saccostrea echinata]|uniref:uncharacterized protein LOC133173298 isoform X2 n=1 Tax=Saccostrea echinata TaxID=191078 RepID=UPI002A820D40|nr:uncharacterized protein LOC133173298 isoform X2 [Saccostrea echinata]